MEYSQEGKDKCTGIREKSKIICELLADTERLEEEREFARKNRDKFASYLGTGSVGTMGAGSGGSKYQGFGSDDLKKYSGGYDIYSGGKTGGYDSYSSKPSVFDTKKKTEKEKEKEKEKAKEKKDKEKANKKKQSKKKKSESESDESDSDDDSDESSSSDEESSEDDKKKTKAKKNGNKKVTIEKPKSSSNKPDKKVPEKVVQTARQAKPDILELLETNDEPVPQVTTKSKSQDDDVLGLNYNAFTSTQTNAQPQNIQNLFENLNISNSQQNQNPLFANMNMSSSQQPFGQSQPSTNSSVFNMGAAGPQQPSVFPQNNTFSTDIFGGASMTQPARPATNNAPARSYDIFGGLTSASQPKAQSTSQQSVFGSAPQTQPKRQASPVDDFDDFQDSAPKPSATKPTDDSWSMGRHLFDLSSLK